MHALGLLLVAVVTTSVPARATQRVEAGAGRRAPVGETTSARARENLLAGPARCVLRYLDAVRLAGPRPPFARPGRAPEARERD